jgi:hypothetical protein
MIQLNSTAIALEGMINPQSTMVATLGWFQYDFTDVPEPPAPIYVSGGGGLSYRGPTSFNINPTVPTHRYKINLTVAGEQFELVKDVEIKYGIDVKITKVTSIHSATLPKISFDIENQLGYKRNVYTLFDK